jgi:hypothetical protein
MSIPCFACAPPSGFDAATTGITPATSLVGKYRVLDKLARMDFVVSEGAVEETGPPGSVFWT